MKRFTSIPIFLFVALLAVALLVSCAKKDVDFLGPSIAYAPEQGFGVSLFSASTADVDFKNDSVVFDAAFSHSVSWILTIKGQSSGAIKEYKGLSDGFEDLVWSGGHNGITFFRTGEDVVATLSFFGNALTASQTITISQALNLKKKGLFPVGGDFESSTLIDFPSWARFNVAQQGVGSVEVDYTGKTVPSVQGESYYYIRGAGTQPVFVDGIQFLGPWKSTLPPEADDVWVNIYVYGTGDANARLDMELQEEDFDGGSFGYTGTEDDAFVSTMILGHKGWKLFSVKYSSLSPSANADFGGSGNAIHEPNRLKSFVLVLLKNNNPDSPVEAYIDYPIFTVGGPFDPSSK